MRDDFNVSLPGDSQVPNYNPIGFHQSMIARHIEAIYVGRFIARMSAASADFRAFLSEVDNFRENLRDLGDAWGDMGEHND